MNVLILVFHSLLMVGIAVVAQPKASASYHNYLTGKGAIVLDDTVGTLEMIDGSRFMSDPDGRLKIIITYGELESKTLGVAWRGSSTCRIVISHVMNPETSVSYDENDLKSVLTHEIGHCFGMDHFEEESHIMYWAYDGKPHDYSQLTKFIEDLKKFRSPILDF